MKKKPDHKKPRLSIIRGGREPPSANSVEGVLRAVLEAHQKKPYSDIFIVAVLPHSQPHELLIDLAHHCRDRIRLFGAMQWAVQRFMTRYLPPMR